jgi:thiosulfate/3-mercaptopyruvate sulfurtransferase
MLLSPEQLNERIAAGNCVVVDCRFDLLVPGRGRAQWRAGHIPGAVYAHLDDDLAAPIDASTGRHPLPDLETFARYLAGIGWTSGHLLVAYDEGSGALASRLWWLMRYCGQRAALLDGGLKAWLRAGFELDSGETTPTPVPVERLQPDPGMVVSTAALAADLDGLTVLDARAAERFSGQTEQLDSRAGHIPGSLNRPFGLNLEADQRFKDPDQLRAEFEQLLQGRDPGTVVNSCGSGVTACHNQFAMELAGIEGGRLYPGSWSEWIRDPSRPIVAGPADPGPAA